MAGSNSLITSITELLVIAVLHNKNSYVYERSKTIESASDGLLSISQNTIYTVTYKLEQEKITEYSKLVGKKHTRVYYHMESDGEKYYNQLLSTYQSMTLEVQNILSLLQRDDTNE